MTKSSGRLWLGAIFSLAIPAVTILAASAATGVCVGDCNDNGTVTVDELLTMVNVALGNAPASVCTAGDIDHDGEIAINEIIAAVTAALDGCPPVTGAARWGSLRWGVGRWKE